MSSDYTSSVLSENELRLMKAHCERDHLAYDINNGRISVPNVNQVDYFTLQQLELYCIVSVP